MTFQVAKLTYNLVFYASSVSSDWNTVYNFSEKTLKPSYLCSLIVVKFKTSFSAVLFLHKDCKVMIICLFLSIPYTCITTITATIINLYYHSSDVM